MSEDYSAQQPQMEWNTQKKIWQLSTDGLLFEHWEPFLGTWQISGTMRNGLVYELPTPEHHTSVSESSLLRSPTASQGEGGALGEEEARKRGNTVGIRDNAMDIARLNGHKVSRVVDNDSLGELTDEIEWGKFEPAIRRWEETLGRPAPLPTKPDGKDGAHRLSSAFTEWMMGLPDGWVTDVGLSRTDELKACGNGVVPQQAELALRILLEKVDF